jgi:tripartite-type tricarboxylate transporter receptor subunit TctC
MVVAFPPGGGTDIVARKIGIELTKLWNQPVIIDNRAGASGTIGTSYVAKAEPNGYTLFFGTLGNLAINQHIYTTDIVPSKDFSAVTNAVGVTFVLVANNNFPPNNVRELIALGKSKQGPFYYSSSGSGGSSSPSDRNVQINDRYEFYSCAI